MAEEVYAVFGLREVSTREEPNRKTGTEEETISGAEDGQGFPGGLHSCFIMGMKTKETATLKKAIKEFYPGMSNSEIFKVKKANLEK